MSKLSMIAAELRKLATLPATLGAIAVTAGGSIGITTLNALGAREALGSGHLETVGYTSPVEAVFQAVPLGTVGAIILGVVAVSSEYTPNSPDAGGGRQITATLACAPNRLALLGAKALAVVLLIAATAAVTIPSCLALAHVIIGEAAPLEASSRPVLRALGTGLYWTLAGLLALTITILTRNGIVPLVVLIANSSIVSISFLLTKITSLAYWLPDLAGLRLFSGDDAAEILPQALDPLIGGSVMAAWTLGLLVVSSAVFVRRDA